MRFQILAALACLSLAGPANAVEPRSITSASKVKHGMGAVRLSIQSQTQHMGTLHVWFLREGGDATNNKDLYKFERKQGVPLMGLNMIDSSPKIFALPAGRYRLLAHGVKCGELPPEGTICSVTEYGNHYLTPTARYGWDAPAFDVVAGQLTDAGEFILEAPVGSPMDEQSALEFAQKNPSVFQVRHRPIAQPVPAALQSLTKGPAMEVHQAYRSAIRCPARPKGAMLYLPFDC